MLYYVCQIYNAVGKFNGVGTEIERVRKSMLVDEAMEILYDEIEKTLNWKFIKSRKTFKKVVEDLVFEITFFSSKWNKSYENIEIQCEFRLWCKKFGKSYNVNSAVGFFSLNPLNESWWNITTNFHLENTLKCLREIIKSKVIPVLNKFETNVSTAANDFAKEPVFSEYNISVQFIDMYAGREQAVAISKKIYADLNEKKGMK